MEKRSGGLSEYTAFLSVGGTGNFDIALGIYEKLRREKKAYGVGLINSGKLEEYDIAPAGSLATVVESKSIMRSGM